MDTNLGAEEPDGIALTQLIRDDSSIDPQPLIFSISSAVQSSEELRKNRMDGLLSKPFSQVALSRLIEQHFELVKPHRDKKEEKKREGLGNLLI